MKVSLIQMESKGTKQQNVKKSLDMLKKAIEDKPDVICLSELFLSWGEEFDDSVVTIEEIEKYKIFAKNNNVNIILGSIMLTSEIEDKKTNTCFVINRKGNIVKRYDKKYMYKVNREDYFVDEMIDTIPGKELGITEIDGVKIGIGICFDLRFPEYFRELIKEGAEIIFLPSHFRKNTGEKAWDILVNARAIENQVFFCACNQTGKGLCAKTKIISYDGEIINQAEADEGIITSDLDLEKQKKYRKEFPVLEQI